MGSCAVPMCRKAPPLLKAYRYRRMCRTDAGCTCRSTAMHARVCCAVQHGCPEGLCRACVRKGCSVRRAPGARCAVQDGCAERMCRFVREGCTARNACLGFHPGWETVLKGVV